MIPALIPLAQTAGSFALKWILPVVASYAAESGIRKMFDDEDSTGADIAATGASTGTFLAATSFGKNASGKYGFTKPSKLSMAMSIIPVGLGLWNAFKSDDPEAKDKIIDAMQSQNEDKSREEIEDTLNKLYGGVKSAGTEMSNIQMGSLIDPTKTIDLNRVQDIENEYRRAKSNYDVMDTMAAMYVIGGLQGGLGMMEKAKMLSAETASKIAMINANKDAAIKGDRGAIGALNKQLDSLDAMLGANGSVIEAYKAKTQADYQNKSLQMRDYSATAKASKTTDPSKNAGTVVQMYNASKNKYLALRKEKGDTDKDVIQAKRDMDIYENQYREMMGMQTTRTGRALTL